MEPEPAGRLPALAPGAAGAGRGQRAGRRAARAEQCGPPAHQSQAGRRWSGSRLISSPRLQRSGWPRAAWQRATQSSKAARAEICLPAHCSTRAAGPSGRPAQCSQPAADHQPGAARAERGSWLGLCAAGRHQVAQPTWDSLGLLTAAGWLRHLGSLALPHQASPAAPRAGLKRAGKPTRRLAR